MNKLIESGKKFTKTFNDQIILLLILLTADYLALFVIETIIPGFVMRFFNLNYLLFLLIAGWLAFVYLVEGKRAVIGKKIAAFVIAFFLVLTALGLAFALYKANFFEITIYIILAFIAGKLITDQFHQNK